MKRAHIAEAAFEFSKLKPESPVLVGVSGGPDSLCLLDGLAQLQIPLIVAHFDHQLRPESNQDAAVVRKVAKQLNVPFVLGSQDVAGFAAEMGYSIEEAARTLRYQFLFEQARLHSAQAVAVGHNADDQVETVLMHLLRGSGLSGLKGMSFRTILPTWDESIPLVRPLLAFTRTEILEHCRERGLQPVFDPTNLDTSFYRNRLRHELIPFLETFNPQARQVIWRTAQVLEGDAAVVQAAVEAAWQQCLVEEETGYIVMRLAELQVLLQGVQRGVIRLAIGNLLPQLRDVDFAAVDRVVQFISQPHSGQVDIVQGLLLFAEMEESGSSRLVIAKAGAGLNSQNWPQLLPEEEQEFTIPGEVVLSSGWKLESEWLIRRSNAPFNASDWQADTRWEAWLDLASLSSRLLELRRPRPGDRFQPLGLSGHSMKLSDFWINEKHPRRARQDWPLVAAGGTIVWIPGFRPAHPYRVTENTQRVLRLRLRRIP
jgi:tRNA(Ile)-lysidine synthase